MRPEDFIQKLPDIEELKPFPTKPIMKLKTDLSFIVSLTMTKDDQYFAVCDQFSNL